MNFTATSGEAFLRNRGRSSKFRRLQILIGRLGPEANFEPRRITHGWKGNDKTRNLSYSLSKSDEV